MFGVAERCPSDRSLYRPTEHGIAFVKGEATVAAAVEIYNNEALAFDTDRVDFQLSLRNRFDLAELLSAQLTDVAKWERLLSSGSGD